MKENAAYTPYHPRWHRQRVSTYWWLGRRSYFLFILRELSSLAVAWFVACLLLLVRAAGDGAVGYQHFLEWARQPIVLALNIACFAFVCLHAVTWFNLAPQAMVVRVGGWRVPGWLIAVSNYAALAATTAVVLALLLLRW
jgi:succinate dehydrogenase subunit C